MKKEIHEILNDKSLLLTQAYFKIQELAEQKYGSDTIVFMEIGTFFEVYEVNNEKEQIGKAKEIAELLNIQLTRKNKNILHNDRKNPLMAGVPSVSFEKHLSRILQKEKYTIIIIKQIGLPPNVKRVVESIISPGTNFDYVVSSEENYITSIFVDKIKNNYLVGFSSIDVTTGKCFYNEVYGTSEDSMFALDEVFNYLIVNKSSEVIITFIDKEINKKEVLDYLELSHKPHHINSQRAKISYQNELFANVFEIKSLLTPIESLDMERYPLASESLAILIDFIIEHDSEIIKKLKEPIKLDIHKYLYLGNNALEQLNIISKAPSVLSLIDFTSTAMGRRLLKERLSHPIKDKKELERRYKLTKDLFDYHSAIEDSLSRIYDIERLNRRIKLNRLHPFELYYLYESLIAIKGVVQFMQEYLFLKPPCSVSDIDIFINQIEQTFYIDKAAKYMLKDISCNIIKPKINAEIDELEEENRVYFQKLQTVKEHILSFLKESDDSFVGVNRLEKEGFYLSITKNRFNSIKQELLKSHLIIDNELYLFKDFNIKIQSNNVKITNKLTSLVTEKYVSNLTKIISLNKTVFKEQIRYYDIKFGKLLSELVNFIAEIDVTISNIKASKKLNLVCPKIIETKEDKNFLEIKDLRHPIIEQKEERGIYVPNDIVLGDLNLIDEEFSDNVIVKNAKPTNIFEKEINGILLYGINSSGKSSLMKSIGIAVILAQSGFFVPASSMRFALFDSIFTRISGADNIARGLSSFAVEMLELKNIFNRSTCKSLILGDEISHSTETLSGLSIVASAIVKLSILKPLFMFATHLHQLPQLQEIKELNNIMALHLSVIYDENSDKLIYNRKLKYGSGSSLYGLEFAKSLHMDSEFLNLASKIRKKLSNDLEPIERLKRKKRSKYNKDLYVAACAICGEAVDDVHHIKEQSKAQGEFIEHFRKNHKYNLIPLCKKHHKMVHSGKIVINGFITTSKGLELHYDILEDKS
jgi:DNA mismatch repair protein MutS